MDRYVIVQVNSQHIFLTAIGNCSYTIARLGWRERQGWYSQTNGN